ncbi:putative CorA-type Mg(2+) transporter [Planococcus antarcticus DSM 14505]|uniref:CorA-type Mg(2+) transporter n=1 Tax=Planococcus antarcticus DSM 14505 TaxID=1185653 RepID=A0A1C7DC42_9BACL|nr:magnesium transporter CorA family protein [Planococcus antarcticus]ANU08987.1 magnesium transporter CorA [Planococcus antarcticus DSM 14505]EIM07236.1 putative CorA-type Mg(2+) transporter [Planococcus antarcticus DSM 14505]
MPQYAFKHAIWHEEDGVEDYNFRKFLPENEKMYNWIDKSKNLSVNILHTHTANRGKEALWGSLIYRQSAKSKDSREVFHFYLSNEVFVTNKIDFEKDADLEKEEILRQMESATSAIEVMVIILGEMVASILHKIDSFEERLHDLLWAIKEENNKKTLGEIENIRHEILLWKHLIMGFQEIKMAIKETFGKKVTEEIEYQRTADRIERCVMLVNSYEDEVNNMVDIENVVANYRGNEIMKTLTVLTTLFTPVMAWGALWGMNFENMPELKWQFGYVGSLLVILSSTFFLYLYLKRKGWMGDILRSIGRKKSGNE